MFSNAYTEIQKAEDSGFDVKVLVKVEVIPTCDEVELTEVSLDFEQISFKVGQESFSMDFPA